VSKAHITASILPLLDDSHPFYLKLDISVSSFDDKDDLTTPFLVLDDGDPLFRLIGAEILTPAQSRAQSVCLMVQNDRIQGIQEYLKPLQNENVAHAWQSAFEFYTTKHQPTKPMLHQEHINENGSLLPLASLFYCKFKQRYFHPTCPTCFQQLELCIDDDLLQKSDLQPYTTSLSRYLYCPTCCQQIEDRAFYVPSKQDKQQELVKDLRQLLTGYGTLLSHNDMEIESIPCVQCNQLNTCYHDKMAVHSRIEPFGFYPFFMLMFPAISLNAHETLRLMSGADMMSLKDPDGADRGLPRSEHFQSFVAQISDRPIFFRDKDDKLFLEILYLKLTFLSKLIESCFPNLRPDEYLDLELSLDRVWIRGLEPDGFHPLMWQFKVSFMGVGPCAADLPEIPGQSINSPLHRLGAIWLHTLLVNQSQNADILGRGILNLQKEFSVQNSEPFNVQAIHTDSFGINPENIFWNPDNKNVDQAWAPLWNRSLELGMSLLNGSLALDSDGSMHTFFAKLLSLRTDVHDTLTEIRPIPAITSPEKNSGDKNAQTILTHILEKWRESFEPEHKPEKSPSDPIPEQSEPQSFTSDDHEEDTAIYETVIISADRFGSKEPDYTQKENHGATQSVTAAKPSAMDRFETADDSDDIESHKTIIVSPNGLAPKSSQANSLDEDVPKTIILSPDKASSNSSPFARQIMSNNIQINNNENNADSDTNQTSQRNHADEELEKTIIQKPSQKD